jgi:hypothetical protein
VQNFVAKHEIPQVQQPPHSPNIAQCDFSSFPEIKIDLKGKIFDDAETIERKRRSDFSRYQKLTSTAVLSNGKAPGISASRRKSVTSKVISPPV